MAKLFENNEGLSFLIHLLKPSPAKQEMSAEAKAINEKNRIVREELPIFCRELDAIAAQRQIRIDPTLRNAKYLSVGTIESTLLPLLDDSYIDEYCDAFLSYLAELDAYDPEIIPTLYYELKMNVLVVKDNLSIIRIYEALLKAVVRREARMRQVGSRT